MCWAGGQQGPQPREWGSVLGLSPALCPPQSLAPGLPDPGDDRWLRTTADVHHPSPGHYQVGAGPWGAAGCSPPCTSPFPSLGSQGSGLWGKQTPDMSQTLSPCSGLLIYPDGPLSLEQSPEQMSQVFSPFYNLLKKIRYVSGATGTHRSSRGAAVGL